MSIAATAPSPFLSRQADRLRALRGWRRIGTCFVAGAVMSLTMPPFGLFPLFWLCLPALVFLLQGCVSLRQSFAVGWWFSFGFLTCSLYWIAASMFVDLKMFWWAIPLSVAGLPGAFALYYGVAAAIAWRVGTRGVSGAVMVALCWFGADWARGHCFTGFPWNILGYGWSNVLPVLQLTSAVGIYGLSLLTTLAGCLAALVIGQRRERQIAQAMIAVFIVIAAAGLVRLDRTAVTDTPGVRLRIVQPDVDQKTKWLVGRREADFEQLLAMSDAPAAKTPTVIVWPETASTFYLDEDNAHRQAIGDHIPTTAIVLTGVIRRALAPNGTTQFFNSLVAVDGMGRLVAGYDKSHLVPFGEYMPWRRFIPVKAIAADMADFTPGDGPRSLRVLGLPPFSPLICYEAIFPGEVTDPKDRPELLVNVTNDGWYGQTIGPYQHFAISRVRAIEEGLPLIRAANTGISGLVDPLGRIILHLGLGQRGTIDGDLPKPLPPTLFTRWREWPVIVCFVLLFISGVYFQTRRKGL